MISAQQPSGGQMDQPLVYFGDFYITQRYLVTPYDRLPLAGTQISVANLSKVERVIPGWAIAMAIIGALFFLLGLFFLLVKETRVSGFMQITVVNGNFTYQTAEPARHDVEAQLFELQNRANYARGVISKA